MQAKSKILMLGWEFPPFVEGGLAAATFGIVSELKKLVDITLLIPKHDKSVDIDGVNIVGLNNIKEEIVRIMSEDIDKSLLQEMFQVLYGPYPQTSSNKNYLYLSEDDHFCINNVKDAFNTGEIYGQLINKQRYFYACAALAQAKFSDFDIIHAHDWVTFDAAVAIKKETGKKLVLHVHSLETDRVGEFARNEVYHIEKRAMEIADAIIPVSNFTKEKIVEYYGIDSSKIFPAHNGIKAKNTAQYSHNLKQKIVVFVGRLTRQKGPYGLLETASRVVAKFKDVLFVISGKGDQMQYLMMEAANKNLYRNFVFTGFLSPPQVEALYSAADVYFMPSVSEPFGLTALEALLSGTPVVISKQSGAAEVLPEVPVADFWDADKFSNQILEILTNEDSKEAKLVNREKIFELSWLATATKINEVYQQLNY